MANNTGIIIDKSCGISEEEQWEILAKIDRITEKNRLSLSGAEEEKGKNRRSKPRFKAKKSGSLFPVLVNAAAFAALAGGFFALYTFQGKTAAQVREGTKVYNSAERALIDEIRKETSSRLEAKESEISQIASKLAGIDAELRELHSGNHELTAEQQAAEEQLRAMQDEYRAAMSLLQDERSRILEEARAREANLQAQLENRTRELALVAEESAAAIDIARAEMDRLNREQAMASTIEAQIGALFANLNSAISENRLEEAAEIVKLTRGFLNTPAFQGLRSIQERKELYAQAINSFETMIEDALRYRAALNAGVLSLDKDSEKLLADLQKQNSQLEQEIEDKNKTLDAISSEGSDLVQRFNELDKSNRDLRVTVNEKDREISSRVREIGVLEQEKSALNETITNRNDRLNRVKQIVDNITEMSIVSFAENLPKIQADLQQWLVDND
ncbi:MAG: hypothetical protein LBG95_00660 [Treponema sp.]|jgi:chromosome segregation ATPase|nr:hypothetical protein [Treponema sp.]